MIIKQLVPMLFLMFSSFAIAQNVVSSTGNSLTSETVSLDYTVGEVTITLLESEQATLDQGFHKGLVIKTVTTTETLKVSVWPNPTSHVFNIKTKDSKIAYTLYDTTMKDLGIKGSVPANSSLSVDISKLTTATYFLKLTDANTNTKILKIIKSN